MSVIEIDYDNLLESSNKAKKLSDELDVYASRITKRVSNPVSGLPGNDNKGYASSILSSASAKIKELNNRSQMFNTYYQNIETFVGEAKDADTRVKNSIKTTAKSYIGKRNIWQATFDWLYNNLYVGFLNKNDLVRGIKDLCKKGWNYVTHFAENARDWFKHGAGKYWWNIASAITSSVLAVVGAVGAIAAIATAGTAAAIALAVIGAIAAVVGGVITLLNSGVKIYNNGKAIAKQKEDPYSARYVGNIGSMSDAVEKYDLGGAEANKNWETAGKAVDTTETVCDVVDIVSNLASLGEVVVDGKVTGYDFSKANIKDNFMKSAGFDKEKKTWNIKEMFDFGTGKSDKLFADENGVGGLKLFNKFSDGGEKAFKTVVDIVGVTKTTMGVMETGDTIYENMKDGLNFSSPENSIESLQKIGYTVIDGVDMLDFFGPVDTVKKYIAEPSTKMMEFFGIKRPEGMAG